jgi:hypothetical protein
MSLHDRVTVSIQVISLLFSQQFGLRTAISIGLPVIAEASGAGQVFSSAVLGRFPIALELL